MLDSNKTISGIWIGNKLSNMELMCIHSFVAHGHDFVLYAYDDIVNVPLNAGGGGRVQVRDANEILPSSKIYYINGWPAHFADWFRLEIMRQKGGWYSDLDVVCLRPWDFADEVVMCKEKGKWFVNNGIMKFPKGHAFAAAMADACANPNTIQPWDNSRRKRRKILRKVCPWVNPYIAQRWGEHGGPEGMTLAVQHFGMEDVLVPTHVFCPLSGDIHESIGHDDFADAMGNVVLEHSHGVHLWASGFNHLDKNALFPAKSLYGKMQRRYLPEYKTP